MSFSFGTPSSAPATGGLTSGFSFGANKPATSGFGLTATSQPSTGLFGSTPATSAPAFGTTTPAFGASSGFGNTSFGASATPAFGASATPAFGATSTAPAFGKTPAFGATSAAPAFGTTTPAFGATSTAPGFGTTSTAPAFGVTSTAPTFGATTAPAFGATAAPAFGGTSAPAFGTGSTAPAFGSTTTPAFGQQTNSLSFGTGLGTGGLNFGAGSNTSTAATGLTLGAPTTTSAGLGGLGGFGFGATTAQSTGLGGGLFGTTTTSAGSLFGAKLGTTTVTGTQPSASAAPSLGLGGVTPSGTNVSASADGKSESPKQTKLPTELASTVDSFKEFVKKQKSLSSEIMRVSIKPLHKVSRSAESTLHTALSLSGEVSRARAHSRRMRAAAARALATAEGVNNTGLELEGTAPPAYVKDLISELEQQLTSFRRQMDVADKQMQAAPKLLTEQELTLGIRRMHESLVALAGRLQVVHAQVQDQKEQYLNLRKTILKDHTNVFENTPSSTSLDDILCEAEGSRKRGRPPAGSGFAPGAGSVVLRDPRAALGNLQQLAGPTPFSYMGNTPFHTTVDTSGISWQPAAQPAFNSSFNSSYNSPAVASTSTPDSSFQLQKPPGKRGKQ